MEHLQSIVVTFIAKTNEQTHAKVLKPEEHESHSQFAARVWDQLCELLEMVNR